MRFYPPETIVSPLKLIRRERLLPAPGEILVEEGERVDPVRVIGVAHVPGGFHILNVAQILGVSNRAARRLLKVQAGQDVKRGQLLAGRRGWGGQACKSPVDGRVTGSGGGRLLIEAAPQDIEVRAHSYGVIAQVYPNRGVVIETTGSLIQGVWGNGQEGFGVLRVMVRSREGTLKERSIDPSSRGVVMVGGSSLDRAALERAVELQVRGIIVGGIQPDLLEEVQKLPFPVIATEGVGVIPMSTHIFQMLSTHDGREAILDGRCQTGWDALRPEIVVPLPTEGKADMAQYQDRPLRPGDRVRAVRAPHTGVTGTVMELPAMPAHLETDARLPAAKVQPEGGGAPLLIPIMNLEVLR